MIEFTVYGVAAPKGSAKAFKHHGTGRVVVTHDNARTKPWGQAVCNAAFAAKIRGEHDTIEGPVTVRVVFYLPRPQRLPKGVTLPQTRPDVDKFIRCVLDGLTSARIYRDDGQVTDVERASKRYAGGLHDPLGAKGQPRVEISVRPTEVANA